MKVHISDNQVRILLILAFISISINLLAFVKAYANYSSKVDSNVLAVGVLSLEVLPQGVCNLKLLPEWNFVSLCANPGNKAVESVTSTISSDFDYILKWNQSSPAYILWSAYSAQKPFTEFELNSSYFIHINKSSSTIFVVNGSLNQNINVSLTQNFSSPSWPYEFNQTISKSLASIGNNYTYVLKWNASDQSYLLYSVFAVSNPFENLSAGEGQFINVNATSELLEYNRTALVP